MHGPAVARFAYLVILIINQCNANPNGVLLGGLSADHKIDLVARSSADDALCENANFVPVVCRHYSLSIDRDADGMVGLDAKNGTRALQAASDADPRLGPHQAVFVEPHLLANGHSIIISSLLSFSLAADVVRVAVKVVLFEVEIPLYVVACAVVTRVRRRANARHARHATRAKRKTRARAAMRARCASAGGRGRYPRTFRSGRS